MGSNLNLLGKERKEVEVEDVIIPFVSFEHLVDSKKAAGRKQDLEDIEYLIKIREKEIP